MRAFSVSLAGERLELAGRDSIASLGRPAEAPHLGIPKERVDALSQGHRPPPSRALGNQRRSVDVATPNSRVTPTRKRDGSRSNACATRTATGSWKIDLRRQQGPCATPGPLAVHVGLELGQRGEHRGDELAARGVGVRLLGQRNELAAARLDVPDELDEVGHVAPEAVELPYRQPVLPRAKAEAAGSCRRCFVWLRQWSVKIFSQPRRFRARNWYSESCSTVDILA